MIYINRGLSRLQLLSAMKFQIMQEEELVKKERIILETDKKTVPALS